MQMALTVEENEERHSSGSYEVRVKDTLGWRQK